MGLQSPRRDGRPHIGDQHIRPPVAALAAGGEATSLVHWFDTWGSAGYGTSETGAVDIRSDRIGRDGHPEPKCGNGQWH